MYFPLELLHILSAVAFLGNITLGVFWQAHAARTRDPKILAYTLEGVARSDVLFTKPGAIGLLLTGLALVWVGHFPFMATGWLIAGLALFIAAGAIFGALALPLRRQMLEMAQQAAQPGASGAFSFGAYAALDARYRRRIGVALAMPFIALAMMVLKPF